MKRILFLLVGLLLISGCSDTDAGSSTPTPSAEIIPASTQRVDLPSPRPTQAPTPTPSPEATPEPELTGKIVNVNEFANVRSEPSADAEKLGEAPLGEEYVVLDEEPSGGWFHIEFGDGEGYVSADYFEVN